MASLLLAFAGLAGSAAGYVIGGKAWPGHVITYHNKFARDARAVRAAVHDWNTSGARVRFVAVRASRAEVTIVRMPRGFFPTFNIPGVGKETPDASGFASIGRVPRGFPEPSPSGHELYRGAHVSLVPVGMRVAGGARLSEATMTDTAVHELGHVLGLNHEKRRCAVMNPSFGEWCSSHPWVLLCADPLQPDDIRGAVALYGGRAPRGGPRLCPVPRPPAPRRLSAHLHDASTGTVRVQWTDPRGANAPTHAFDPYSLLGRVSIFGYELFGHTGACNSRQGGLLDVGPAHAAEQQYTDIQLADGPWCLRLRIEDAFGRYGGPATLQTTFPGAGTPGSPTAKFTHISEVRFRHPVSVRDLSQRRAARIVRVRV